MLSTEEQEVALLGFQGDLTRSFGAIRGIFFE